MSSINNNLEALAHAWIALRHTIDSLPCDQQEVVRRRAVELGAVSPLSAKYARQSKRTFGVVTFGEFSLFPLSSPQDIVKIRSRKGRELFCYLLASGSSGLSKERISQELWFDSISENISAVVDVCLAHLRHDLAERGLTSVIYCKNHRYYIDKTHFKCDFDSYRIACESFQKSPSLITALHIVDIHKGDFMANFEAIWAIPDRLRYNLIWKKALCFIQGIHAGSGKDA